MEVPCLLCICHGYDVVDCLGGKVVIGDYTSHNDNTALAARVIITFIDI